MCERVSMYVYICVYVIDYIYFYIINIYVIERWDNSAEQCKENDTRSLSSHRGVDVSGSVFPTFPPKLSDNLSSVS